VLCLCSRLRARLPKRKNQEGVGENGRALRGKKAASLKKSVEKKLAKKRATPAAGGSHDDLIGEANIGSEAGIFLLATAKSNRWAFQGTQSRIFGQQSLANLLL